MSLRLRLAVLFGVVGFVASGLVGGFAFRSTTTELTESTDRFLSERAGETVDALTANDGRVDLGNLIDVVDGIDTGGRRPQRPGRIESGRPVAADDAITQVTGPNGRSITSSIELPFTAGAEAAASDGVRRNHSSDARFEDIEIDDEPYRLLSRGLSNGAVVQVARSVEEEEALGATLLRRFILIAAVVALAAAAVGSLIARRTTAPLRRLTEVAAGVATTRDFTTGVDDVERSDEIGRLATSFRSMLDALEASRLQQHRLIHDAGHELRTPLTSMRANVALLERAADLPAEERAEVLGAISSELVELSALFDEMIDLATDQRDAELVRGPVDLGDLAEEVAATWRRRSGRAIPVTVAASETGRVVSADSSMLERALANLVSNAVKFSPDGAAVEIVVDDRSVAVRDDGDGIAVDERDRIFGRFYRSETTRSMPGSGLGLSIVEQIVHRHGGSTWVGDAAGGGAEIGFRLPAS